MVRVVVCVSGGGTNLQAILDGVADGSIRQTQIVGVISNNPGVMALTRAEKAGVPGYCICPADYADREAFHQALLDKLAELSPDLIVLAGFLVRIPEEMIRRYERRILNIHPSLIPSYCGVGYYGLKVHEGCLARGSKITGATVHFVDAGMDSGPILLQKAVEVRPDNTPKTLQRRVMEEAEWVLLPKAIDASACGNIDWIDGKPWIREN